MREFLSPSSLGGNAIAFGCQWAPLWGHVVMLWRDCGELRALRGAPPKRPPEGPGSRLLRLPLQLGPSSGGALLPCPLYDARANIAFTMFALFLGILVYRVLGKSCAKAPWDTAQGCRDVAATPKCPDVGQMRHSLRLVGDSPQVPIFGLA